MVKNKRRDFSFQQPLGGSITDVKCLQHFAFSAGDRVVTVQSQSGSESGRLRHQTKTWSAAFPKAPRFRGSEPASWKPGKHAANTEQTRSKHAANTEQTRSKHAANTEQTRSKHAANTEQTRSKHGANTEQNVPFVSYLMVSGE